MNKAAKLKAAKLAFRKRRKAAYDKDRNDTFHINRNRYRATRGIPLDAPSYTRALPVVEKNENDGANKWRIAHRIHNAQA